MAQSNEAVLRQPESLVVGCLAPLRYGDKINLAENVGSFAGAQHGSAEFTLCFAFDRAPLASIALGANDSVINAIGNNHGYEQILAHELRAEAEPEDVFIAISTSGNSANVIVALEQAFPVGVKTAVPNGQMGGKLKGMCDCGCECVHSHETARIQECHILPEHILHGLVEEQYFSKQMN